MATVIMILTILWCFLVCSALADVPCILPMEASTDAKLRNDIFCKYDRYVRPRFQSRELINVTIQLDIKHVSVHDFHNDVTVHTWFVISWVDIFAKWIPGEYEDIQHIVVQSDVLWIPDIVIFNTDSSSKILFQASTCVLYYTGVVTCTPDVRAPLYCELKLRNWPYDIQNCSMVVGSWTWGYNINVMAYYSSVVYTAMTENKSWKLLNVTVQRHGDDESYLEYNFLLQRHAAMHVASVVVPAFGKHNNNN